MPRSLSTGLRFVFRGALRSRLLRWIGLVYLLFWAFDQAIEMATDASWFASVGHARLFWHLAEVRALLFWGFALPAWLLAVVTMRVVAHPGAPGAEPPPLPPALRDWNQWRSRATKVGWLVLLLAIWILGRRLASEWAAALQFWYSAPWDGAPARLLPSFWVFQLPFGATVLQIVWQYVLVLFGVLACCGGLRALPFLAARHMVVPHRWERLLVRLGCVLLALRALGYGLEAVRLPVGGPLFMGDLGVGTALCALGGALCLWAMLGLRRSVKRTQLGGRIGALVLVPPLFALLLWPVRTLVNSTHSAALERFHESATRSAWAWPTPAPLETFSPQTPRFERTWPLWDEHYLLLAARGQVFDTQDRIVDWRLVGEREVDGKAVGLVVGTPAGLQSYGAWHDADKGSANIYVGIDRQAVSVGNNDGLPVRLTDLAQHKASQTLSNQFYGMSGPSLYGDGAAVPRHGVAGLPFESVFTKLAWAWRLRSPVLLFEGYGARRLLVFRDIRVAAQKLAPMFAWDAIHPGLDEWTLEGYGASREFPGSLAAPTGALRGWNAARPSLLLHLDPATGALALGATNENPFVATWKRALPELWSEALPSEAAKTAPFFAYEDASVQVESALASTPIYRDLGERFWSVRGGKAVVMRRVSVPSEAIARLRNLDARAHGSWKEDGQLENGVPVLWPDARAPGGYWVARPYFAVTETPGLGERVKLDRVLLSALAPTAPIAEGDPVSEAVSDFEGQVREQAIGLVTRPIEKTGKTTPDRTFATLSRDSLEAQLLRAHDDVEKYFANSQWIAYGRAVKREGGLLRELARRHATPTPRPSTTPSASAMPKPLATDKPTR